MNGSIFRLLLLIPFIAGTALEATPADVSPELNIVARVTGGDDHSPLLPNIYSVQLYGRKPNEKNLFGIESMLMTVREGRQATYSYTVKLSQLQGFRQFVIHWGSVGNSYVEMIPFFGQLMGGYQLKREWEFEPAQLLGSKPTLIEHNTSKARLDARIFVSTPVPPEAAAPYVRIDADILGGRDHSPGLPNQYLLWLNGMKPDGTGPYGIQSLPMMVWQGTQTHYSTTVPLADLDGFQSFDLSWSNLGNTYREMIPVIGPLFGRCVPINHWSFSPQQFPPATPATFTATRGSTGVKVTLTTVRPR